MLNLLFSRSALPISAAAARPAASPQPRRLSQVKTGQQVTIAGFDRLSPPHCQHLQAYGLVPGRRVQVLAQNPVTIVLVEQTELAFESSISDQVIIE